MTGQTPQRREFGFTRFLAATSPHERIVERFLEERGPYKTDDEEDDPAAEFSLLSRRHTADTTKLTNNAAVHRSASMNDLSLDPTASGAPSSLVQPGFRTGIVGGGESLNPLHRAVSVEGVSTIANNTKDNKENFAVPQDPPAAGASGSKKLSKQSSTGGGSRKVLNAQNSKS